MKYDMSSIDPLYLFYEGSKITKFNTYISSKASKHIYKIIEGLSFWCTQLNREIDELVQTKLQMIFYFRSRMERVSYKVQKRPVIFKSILSFF